jgi:hypothetical protein
VMKTEKENLARDLAAQGNGIYTSISRSLRNLVHHRSPNRDYHTTK